jgi:hypothetical protein
METTPRNRARIGRAILIPVIATAVIATSATAAPRADANQANTSSDVIVEGATPDERKLVEWALSRYETAGLRLPTISFAFHDSNEGCRGSEGTYQGLYKHATRTIDICNRGSGSTDPRHTLLHELAHAWSLTNMTDDDITEFVAHRGLDHWYSNETPWWQMGQEQAAEIIAWGLQDADEYKSIWLFLESCEDLTSSFELVTSTEPLHTNTEYCA